jgi:hypothetical protein
MSGLVAWIPVGFALVAEASWIAVIAGLFEAFVLRPPTVGVFEMLLAVGVGLVSARFVGPRLGSRWPAVAVGLTAACGLAGWLWSAEVRAVLHQDGIRAAFGANPGGWLAGVAFVRGMGYARIPIDPRRVGTLVAVGVPGLALAAITGRLMGEPWRGDFLSTAQLQVLLFLGSSLTALVLARVALAAGGTAVDWRRNPAWLVMVVLLLTATLVVAVWVSLTAGEVISMALTALVVPVLLIGFVAGIDRRTLRILLVCVAAAGLIAVVVRLLQSLIGPNQPAPLPPAGVGEQPQEPVQATLLGLAILVAVVVVIILVLARLALRRGPALIMDDEIREIANDEEQGQGERRRRRSRFRRRPAPTDAVAAYRDLLEDIDGRPPVAREPGETPSEHARRLRRAGVGGLALDLLAADYGLARFGGVALTPAEHRRAIARFAGIRRRLLAVPVVSPATDDDTDAPTGQARP